MHEPAPSPSPSPPDCTWYGTILDARPKWNNSVSVGVCSFFFLILRGWGPATLCSKEWFNSLQMGFSESFFAEFMEGAHRCGTDAITADWLADRGALSHTTCAVELRYFILLLLLPPPPDIWKCTEKFWIQIGAVHEKNKNENATSYFAHTQSCSARLQITPFLIHSSSFGQKRQGLTMFSQWE